MIKKLSFKKRGKIVVYMNDGRTITIPIKNFPSLKKLPVKKRKKYIIVGANDNPERGIIFNKDILFEVKDFLAGKEIFA
jgi:hypothetical protein